MSQQTETINRIPDSPQTEPNQINVSEFSRIDNPQILTEASQKLQAIENESVQATQSAIDAYANEEYDLIWGVNSSLEVNDNIDSKFRIKMKELVKVIEDFEQSWNLSPFVQFIKNESNWRWLFAIAPNATPIDPDEEQELYNDIQEAINTLSSITYGGHNFEDSLLSGILDWNYSPLKILVKFMKGESYTTEEIEAITILEKQLELAKTLESAKSSDYNQEDVSKIISDIDISLIKGNNIQLLRDYMRNMHQKIILQLNQENNENIKKELSDWWYSILNLLGAKVKIEPRPDTRDYIVILCNELIPLH